MFVLDEPYISQFCIDTINKNNYPVLENPLINGDIKNIVSKNNFVSEFLKTNKLYTNSENSLNFVISALSETEVPKRIEIFKDKIKTREILSKIYPDFLYKKIKYDELTLMNPDEYKYPFVIKPSVGFLSFGVHTVWSKEELKQITDEIKASMDEACKLFPECVLNKDNFIIEDYIEGDEFAVDVYYDKNSKPIILNIFKHPFSDKFDVSDRMYITSSEIIKKHINSFEQLFSKIGNCLNLSNFPMHIELRADKNKIIPIEINPYRFAGWCLTDIAYFAYGINPYEYYMEDKRPDWNSILASNDSIYAFVMAEVGNLKKEEIKEFDIKAFNRDLNAEIMDVREYDFMKKPMFASMFIKTDNYDKIKHILKMNTANYIRKK